MVGSLLHPLNIFILGLGGGFLIPLLYRLGKTWVVAGFIGALAAMTLISVFCAVRLFYGAEPIEILTGGSTPPYSINLRMGLAEAFAATSVNLIGLLGALYFVREKYTVMLLYLVIVMGIQGMVMTRDSSISSFSSRSSRSRHTACSLSGSRRRPYRRHLNF